MKIDLDLDLISKQVDAYMFLNGFNLRAIKQNGDNYSEILEWLSSDIDNLIVLGNVGRGKTLNVTTAVKKWLNERLYKSITKKLAKSILKAEYIDYEYERMVCFNKVGAKYINLFNYFDICRLAYTDREREQEKQSYMNEVVLVLDEVKNDNFTPEKIKQLESLIDYRYSNELSTIIITNEKDLTFLPPMVMSRLQESVKTVVFSGADRRLKGGE